MYDGGTGMAHNMPMFFHFGASETVLFSWWQVSDVACKSWHEGLEKRFSLTALIATCVAIAVIAIIYEGVKWGRVSLDEWHTRSCSQAALDINAQSNIGNEEARQALNISNSTEHPVVVQPRPVYKTFPIASNDLIQPSEIALALSTVDTICRAAVSQLPSHAGLYDVQRVAVYCGARR